MHALRLGHYGRPALVVSLIAALIAAVVLAAPGSGPALSHGDVVVLACDVAGSGGDNASFRGIRFTVEQPFSAVEVRMDGSAPGSYSFEAQLRRSAGFLAAVEASVPASVEAPGTSDVTPYVVVHLDFPFQIAVEGEETFTLAFTDVSGPGVLYVETTGIGGFVCPGVEETDENDVAEPTERADPGGFRVLLDQSATPTPTGPPPLAIKEQLGDCLAQTNIAWGLNNQSKGWASFDPDLPDGLQGLTQLVAGGGYLLNTAGDCTLSNGGEATPLYAGWNLFGWLGAAAGGGGAAPFGQWLDFPGPGSGYVEVPHDPALNPTGAITIEAWVYLRSYSGVGQEGGTCPSLVGKDWTQAFWLGLACGAPAPVRFYPRGSQRVDGSSDVPLNAWTHIAVTYDGTTTNLYLNGELDLSSPAISGPPTESGAPLRIGNDAAWDNTPMAAIDEVRIWNVALTQAEIQATIDAPIAGPQPGLVAAWHFDGDAQDAVGGHHGSLVGDVAFTGLAVLPIREQLGNCLAETNVAWGLNNLSKAWGGFDPDLPDALQGLTAFARGGGYFLNTAADCAISSGPNDIDTYAGWNLFGWR